MALQPTALQQSVLVHVAAAHAVSALDVSYKGKAASAAVHFALSLKSPAEHFWFSAWPALVQ